MVNVKDIVKEYKSHKGICSYCGYNGILFGGRCYTCKNGNWFVDKESSADFIIRRILENAKEEFLESEKGIELKNNLKFHEDVYERMSHYVDSQKAELDKLKEELDSMLDKKCAEYNKATLALENAAKEYSKNKLREAIRDINFDCTDD